MASALNRLRLGIIGLGQAGAMIIDEMRAAPDLPWTIAAGADPRAHAQQRFAAEFGGGAYADAAELNTADRGILDGCSREKWRNTAIFVQVAKPEGHTWIGKIDPAPANKFYSS